MNTKLIQTENIRHALQFFYRNAIPINPLHRETYEDARKELNAMTVRLAELEAVLSAGALLEFQEWPNKPPAGSTVLMVWKDGTYEVMDNGEHYLRRDFIRLLSFSRRLSGVRCMQCWAVLLSCRHPSASTKLLRLFLVIGNTFD